MSIQYLQEDLSSIWEISHLGYPPIKVFIMDNDVIKEITPLEIIYKLNNVINIILDKPYCGFIHIERIL